MRTTHRSRWATAVGFLAVAACSSGGGASTDTGTDPDIGESVVDTGLGPPISESVFLESADGVLTIEVPAGSVREGIDLGIDVIDPAEVDGLADATPIGPAYRLRPTGLRFTDPLVASFRLPADPTGRLPLMIAVVAADGVVEAEIEGHSEFLDDGDLAHRSTIDHFGDIVLLDGGLDFAFEPQQVAGLTPGDSFDATFSAGVTGATIEPWPDYDLQLRWSVSGAVSGPSEDVVESSDAFAVAGDDDWIVATEITCDVVGAGVHRAEVRVDAAGLPGDTMTSQFLSLVGESTCGEVGR